ncbi:hypothetical protein Tco_0517576 [Tanacetum coccineum]
MNPIATQQVALDNSLVAHEKRLKIEKRNARIAFSKPQREETYQVTLDALKLSPCYPEFLVTTEVLEVYMHQLWNTIQKICPIILNQDFIAPLLEEELVTFIQEHGCFGKCDMLSAIHTDQMHQPWRTFATIINRCISGKTTGHDRIRESRAQLLWGIYNKKNVDYVALLWEDFMYQAGNRVISSTRKEHMSYPRFTKVIFSHIISKDKTISMRNRINLHIIRDDSLLDDMINQDIRDSKAYKTYYDFATGKVPPKKARKYKKVSLPSRKLSPVLEKEPTEKPKKAKKPTKKSTIVPTTGVVIRDTPGVPVSKKKAPSKGDRGKGMELLSDATLLKATQVKEALQKSKKDSHMLHASGSGDRVCSQQKVVDESQDKTTGTNKGTSTKLGVPNDDDEDDVESDANDDKEASDSEKTYSNEDENLNFNQNDDEKEKKKKRMYVHLIALNSMMMKKSMMNFIRMWT